MTAAAPQAGIMLYWGEPACARHYCSERLSPADRIKAPQRQSERQRQEWQVSRALIQHTDHADSRSLSHGAGHAVLACAPQGWPLGVDLERLHPRDVLRIARHSCSPEEQRDLQALPLDQALRHFYRLWTLKEAVIKAAGLPFHAGLKQTTLWTDATTGHRQCQLPVGNWSLRIYELAPEWIVSVVWGGESALEPAWQAGPGAMLPDRNCWLALDRQLFR